MAEYNPSKIVKDGNTYNFRDDTKIPLAGSNAISGDLIPATTDSVNLGTSTNKWKSFNGLNPGALSLPDSAGIVDILSTLQTTGFTASIDGYVRANKYVNSSVAHTFGIKNTNTDIEMRSIAERSFVHNLWVPVRAGEKVVISDDWESESNVSKDYSAFFIPCKGNV